MWERVSKLISRENIMGIIGTVGFFHEMLSHGAERPVFLGLCGTLMTLPFAIGADRLIRRTQRNGVESGGSDK